MVKLDVPKSGINFEIGGENFLLSLSDTSRGRYLEAFDKVSNQEVKDLNKRDIEITEYNQQQANMKARYATDETKSAVDYKKASILLENEFSKRMKKNNSNRTKVLIQLQYEFLDVCFGKGSGKKLFKICDESTIVLNKVIRMIIAEIQKNNNINDFYDDYRKKIEEMKPDELADTEQTQVQESDL